MISSCHDVAVVGAGLNGLATAAQLGRRGASVVLLDQFPNGHDRGSSHGESRMTRSTYPDAVYVDLVRVANTEEWPWLEKMWGSSLIHRRPACVYGPREGMFSKYLEGIRAGGADVLEHQGAEVPAHPYLRINPEWGVLEDKTAGVIAAHETMRALRTVATQYGVEIRDEERVDRIDRNTNPIQLITSRGVVKARRLVITAGAWAARLVPLLADHITVTRQTVGYFRLEGPDEMHGLEGAAPWIFLGRSNHDLAYGMPGLRGPNIKAAWHVVAGEGDNPDEPDTDPSVHRDALMRLAEELFHRPVRELVGMERCLYSVTPTEDFVMDALPDDHRVVIGAGFSGHGFKFGPLTGRILAELALSGESTVRPYTLNRKRFQIPVRS